MAPLCTALTIMALRRATHRFVSGGGKLTGIVFICRKTSSFDGSLSITFSAMNALSSLNRHSGRVLPTTLRGSPIIAPPLTSPRRGADGERGRSHRDQIRYLRGSRVIARNLIRVLVNLFRLKVVSDQDEDKV